MRIALMACVITLAGAACAQPAAPAADRIAGDWRGTSICTDHALAPACHDEVIHYVFSARGSGVYHQAAYKLIDGVEDLMGEADFLFDAADNRWTFAFSSPACPHCLWWYRVDASGHLRGGITSQSGRELRSVSATHA